MVVVVLAFWLTDPRLIVVPFLVGIRALGFALMLVFVFMALKAFGAVAIREALFPLFARIASAEWEQK